MLEDDVWRLEKIGKHGIFHKKLEAEGINTVQDFLKLFVVNPMKLRGVNLFPNSKCLIYANIKFSYQLLLLLLLFL